MDVLIAIVAVLAGYLLGRTTKEVHRHEWSDWSKFAEQQQFVIKTGRYAGVKTFLIRTCKKCGETEEKVI